MPRKAKKSTKAPELEIIALTETGAVQNEPEAAAPAGEVKDPIGDTTDGEARTYTGDAPAEEKMPAPGKADTASKKKAVKAKRKELPAVEEPEGGIGAEADKTARETPADEKMPASGEADAAFEKEAVKAKPEELAADDEPEGGIGAKADDEETERPEAEPAKLERLQKILSQAGISSRRRAEELITEGRVQVNGTVVTTLGSKADAKRDHIRVDGKLLRGAERLRYFELNKPKGFVTTVRDPEGRPTVMQFFEKTPERLYPVGRLDYQSEGLLLVTNDGDLANRLTKAGSGVEKTYLVKVAGRPSEEELETLRGGVMIEHGEAGSRRVRTAPARVRQVRTGDNPWFEVVLIEGRNRELRKMFSAIGHFVEKIRRVGYGPLVLDVEPGKMRELDPAEVDALRLTAEGKLPRGKGRGKQRDFARHMDEAETVVLPASSGRPRTTPPAGEKRFEKKRFAPRTERGGFRGSPRGEFRGQPRNASGSTPRSKSVGEPRRASGSEFRPKRSFGTDKPRFEGRGREDRPREGRAEGRTFRPGARPAYERPSGPGRGFSTERRKPEDREERGFGRARRAPEEREGRSFSRPRSDEREERGFSKDRRGPQEGRERGFRSGPPRERSGRGGTAEGGRPAFKPRFDRPRREEREGSGERPTRPRTAKPRFQGEKKEGSGFGREKTFGGRSSGSGYGEKPRTGRGNRSFGQEERPRAGRVRPPRTEGGFKGKGAGKGSFKSGPPKKRGAKTGRPQRRSGGGFGKKRS